MATTFPYSIAGRLAAAAALLLTFTGVEGHGRASHGWFGLLRWVVCAASVWGAYIGWKHCPPITIILAAVAIMFNPIAQIDMTRKQWHPVDIACALVLAASCVWVREKKFGDTDVAPDGAPGG